MCAKVTLQHKLEIRDRIISAALISFSKKRFDKTRMDDLALRVKFEQRNTLYLF